MESDTLGAYLLADADIVFYSDVVHHGFLPPTGANNWGWGELDQWNHVFQNFITTNNVAVSLPPRPQYGITALYAWVNQLLKASNFYPVYKRYIASYFVRSYCAISLDELEQLGMQRLSQFVIRNHNWVIFKEILLRLILLAVYDDDDTIILFIAKEMEELMKDIHDEYSDRYRMDVDGDAKMDDDDDEETYYYTFDYTVFVPIIGLYSYQSVYKYLFDDMPDRPPIQQMIQEDEKNNVYTRTCSEMMNHIMRVLPYNCIREEMYTGEHNITNMKVHERLQAMVLSPMVSPEFRNEIEHFPIAPIAETENGDLLFDGPEPLDDQGFSDWTDTYWEFMKTKVIANGLKCVAVFPIGCATWIKDFFEPLYKLAYDKYGATSSFQYDNARCVLSSICRFFSRNRHGHPNDEFGYPNDTVAESLGYFLTMPGVQDYFHGNEDYVWVEIYEYENTRRSYKQTARMSTGSPLPTFIKHLYSYMTNERMCEVLLRYLKATDFPQIQRAHLNDNTVNRHIVNEQYVLSWIEQCMGVSPIANNVIPTTTAAIGLLQRMGFVRFRPPAFGDETSIVQIIIDLDRKMDAANHEIHTLSLVYQVISEAFMPHLLSARTNFKNIMTNYISKIILVYHSDPRIDTLLFI